MHLCEWNELRSLSLVPKVPQGTLTMQFIPSQFNTIFPYGGGWGSLFSTDTGPAPVNAELIENK